MMDYRAGYYKLFGEITRALCVLKRGNPEAAEKLLRAHRGRLLLRPSGTEPLVRILAEAEEEKICSAAAESVRRAIEEARDIKS